MKNHVCPCCGYPELSGLPYKEMQEGVLVRSLDPPYSRYFGDPSYEVCSCCGYEFGNDDEPGTGAAPASFETYLNEWTVSGCHWFCPDRQPKDWSLAAQLAGKKIIREFPVKSKKPVTRASA